MNKWEMVRFGDVVDEAITGEWGTECAEGEVGTKVLRTTNFTNLGIINYFNVVERNIPASKVQNKKLKQYDIILEKSGGSDNQPVGRVVFFDKGTDNVYLCNNFTQVLRIKQSIAFPRYIFLYLFRLHQNGTTELLQNKTTGIRNLQVKQYMLLEIPLPPLPVQQQLADALDRASVLIEKRKAQIDKLDLLMKSQFIEMFGDPVTNPKGWEVEPLGNHLKVVGGYAFKSTGYKADGIPVLRIGNINTGVLTLNDMVYWDYDKSLERYILHPNDLVISLTGTVGKDDYANVCILPALYPRYYLNQRNAKIDVSGLLNNHYLLYLFREKEIKKRLTGISRGIRQANISNSDILNLRVPIPPASLQTDFSSFVQQVETQKSLLQQSLAKLELNYKSLAQECFRGEVF
jgi:type I restriction enzyme S subunit